MKRAAFAVPGDLATPTGGFAYDRRIIAELGTLGWQIDVIDLGEGFPFATPALRTQADAQLSRLPPGMLVVIDGLALGVLPDAARALARNRSLVALVHHPLALETGLSVADAAALRDSERAALACARHVVCTSRATAGLLVADYAVPADQVTVVPPGVDRPLHQASPRRNAGPVSLLAVGTVTPRKGYDVLVAALATLLDLPWTLVIVGDRDRSPDTARQVDADIARLGLVQRIRFTGAIGAEQVPQHYAAADLFVLASRFEGYGMVYAEAIAHGLPVIGTHAGAQAVPADAGLLVPPDDVPALARALRRVIGDAAGREILAAGARAAATAFPSWRQSAALFAAVLEKAA